MSDKVSIKVPRKFFERFENFRGHFGFRSFNSFVDHAVMAFLEKHESRFEMYKLEKERVERGIRTD